MSESETAELAEKLMSVCEASCYFFVLRSS